MITIGKSTFKRAYFNNKKPTIYLGTQLINPVVWDPSLTDKTSEVHIIGDVVLNGKTDCYSLMFEEGGHLTINGGARLRVWEGGITNNDCTTVNYLTIVEDTVNDSYGEFLLHPDVTVNNHPLGSVELISKSYREGSNIVYQRFGIPTYENNVKMEYANPSSSSKTWIVNWDYVNNDWAADWISVPIATGLNINVGAPFTCFEIYSNNAKADTMRYMFNGNFIGNNNVTTPPLNIGYNPYNNSFIGCINTKQFLHILEEYSINSIHVRSYNDDSWIEINSQNVSQWPYIQPIYCCFMIQNNGLQNLTLNYKDLVWDPSFEEEVTPTRSLLKGNLMSSKPTEVDTALEGSGIFDNPEPVFPFEDENVK